YWWQCLANPQRAARFKYHPGEFSSSRAAGGRFMSISIYFGRVVKQLRDSRRLSQEALAERADLNRTYLGEVERGVAVPSLATVAKIAAAFGVSTSELLARSESLLKGESQHAELETLAL